MFRNLLNRISDGKEFRATAIMDGIKGDQRNRLAKTNSVLTNLPELRQIILLQFWKRP